MKELRESRLRNVFKLSSTIANTLVQLELASIVIDVGDVESTLEYIRDQVDSEEELKLLRAIEHYLNSIRDY